MTLKIAVLIYDGFDELDALGPYEVLKNAALAGADARVNLVTVEPATSATGNHGVSVAAHGFLRDGVDVLIVPGGTWEELNEPGARAEFERGALPQRVAALHARGTTVASVCSGAMLLSAASLLRGRPATTHHGARADLALQGADVVDARVVDGGDVLTAAGVTAGIDLGLWLVEKHWGRELADRVAHTMEYERQGEVRLVFAQAAAGQ